MPPAGNIKPQTPRTLAASTQRPLSESTLPPSSNYVTQAPHNTIMTSQVHQLSPSQQALRLPQGPDMPIFQDPYYAPNSQGSGMPVTLPPIQSMQLRGISHNPSPAPSTAVNSAFKFSVGSDMHPPTFAPHSSHFIRDVSGPTSPRTLLSISALTSDEPTTGQKRAREEPKIFHERARRGPSGYELHTAAANPWSLSSHPRQESAHSPASRTSTPLTASSTFAPRPLPNSPSSPTFAVYQPTSTIRQADATIPPAQSRFKLHIRQQPRAARAGPDGKDRRVIDPPPVLQLTIDDFNPDSPDDIAEIKYPFFVAYCSLISASSPRQDFSSVTSPPGPQGRRDTQRWLLGNYAISPFFTDSDPDPATSIAHPSSIHPPMMPPPDFSPNPQLPALFFIFADLSVRRAGNFRLEFKLMRMEPQNLERGNVVPVLHTITSEPFKVVNAKDFDQIQPSTSLVKGLLERGAPWPLKLKKGPRGGASRSGGGSEAAGDGDSDDDE